MMKRYLTLLLSVLVLLPGAGLSPAAAQQYEPVPVTVSKEKVRGSDGKVYYSHVVLERQTLFSISKAYSVSIDEIYAANPGLREEGLKKNSILLIPVAATAPAEAASGTAPASQPAKAAETPAPTLQKGEYISHTVRWYEDLNDIAAKYNVPAEVIARYNQLTDGKVKNRQKLKIPRHYSESDAAEPAPGAPAGTATADSGTDTTPEEGALDDDDNQPGILPAEDETEEEEEDGETLFDAGASVNAVLLLPFSGVKESIKDNNLDFYSGVLMAVRDLGNQGIGTELSVYDVGAGTLPVNRERLNECDLVIGPVTTADLEKVLALDNPGTAVVSPLEQKAVSLLGTHPNLIQAPTPYYAQYADLVRWIKEDCQGGDRVLVISEKGAKDTGMTTAVTHLLDQYEVTWSQFSYSILEGRNVGNILGNHLSSTGVNRIVITSDSESFLSDVLRNLNLMVHRKYDIILYAPASIRSNKTIEVENFHSLNMHACLSYFIDYDDPRVKRFLMSYRALFKAEPTPFSFQGYDVASYFIKACSKGGRKWRRKLPQKGTESLLQSDFRLISSGEGLVNQGVRRVVYETDFSIRPVK